MVILHTADLHVGASKSILPDNYLSRQSKMLTEILHLVKTRKVKFLVIAGDLFEKGQPTQDEKNLVLKWLIKLDLLGFCKIILISGNHDEDTVDKNALDTFKYLSEDHFKNLHVIIKKPQNLVFDDICFACVPWNFDLYDSAKQLWEKSKKYQVKNFVVVGHLPLPGITTDTGWFIKGSHKLLGLKFVDAFFLGDIHARSISEDGRLQMPGCAIQHSFADKPNKGVSLISLKDLNKPELVELNVPKLIVTKDLKKAKKQAAQGKIVKLVSNAVIEEDLPEGIVDVVNSVDEQEAIDYESEFSPTEGLPEFLAEKGLKRKDQKIALKIIEKLCKQISNG